MLIAFPVDDELSPVLRNRRVYNFLPIREYGFSFILQADFMLGANREDVLQESAWNMCLISATAQLFVESVKAFNQQDILKYSWPRYLTSQGKTYDSAFSDFFDNLLRSLRARPVLESQALTMQHPQELESVRAEFTDGTHPLFTGPRGLAGFAHNGYNPVDLANLSVAQQSATQFLSLLEDYLKTQHGDFTQRSPTWHSSLAAAILVIDPKTVKSLRLIPLRSGQWVSAKGNKLFFPDVAAGIIIPQGIDVDVVEDSAVEDEARRSLYTALGVCTQDEAKVFDLILQQHARHSASSTSWCVADVVEHAWFLFRSESQPATFDLQKLLLFSGDGLLHHGQDLYMDTPNSSNAVSKVLGEAASDVHYLHEQYLAKAEGFPVGDPRGHRSLTLKWTTWLQQEAGVRTMPKLVVNDHISPEFESLINASSNNQWLQLLKDGWHVYKADLEAPANARLRNQLTDINVLCLDGQWRKLSNVYLPSTSVLSEPLAKGNVPMVVVRDADDYGWRIFGRSLRLHMAPDAQLFIRILLRMRQGACGFSLDDVKRMYSGVSRNFNVDAM